MIGQLCFVLVSFCRLIVVNCVLLIVPGRALCHECNAREKAAAIGKYICHKCHAIIDEGAPLKYKVGVDTL